MEIFYADLYFAENAALCALGLFVTSRVLPRPLTLWRLIVSALLGGICALFIALFPLGVLWRLLFFFSSLGLSVYIAFPARGWRRFLKESALFFVCLILLGGTVNALSALAGLSDGESGALIWLIALLLFWVGGGLFFALAARRMETKTVVIAFPIGKKCRRFSALADSGNLAVHPQSGLPVVLMSRDAHAVFSRGGGEANAVWECVRIRTAAGEKILSGIRIRDAALLHGHRTRKLDPFFLAPDPDSRDFGGCDLLFPTTLL